MRRKLDLAMSLISRPTVLFLDEPTTGLDPRSRQAVWDVLAALVATGVTIFLTTQYLEEADRLADRIAVIDGGRVIATGTADELKSRVGTEQVELLLDDPATLSWTVSTFGDSVVRADPAGPSVRVATDGTAAHVKHVLDQLERKGIGVASIAAPADPRRRIPHAHGSAGRARKGAEPVMTATTHSEPKTAPIRWAVDDSLTMIQRSIRHSTRQLDSLLVTVALPVLLMLMFVYVFGGAIDTGGDYVNYVVPGIILLCTGFGASTTAVDVASDMTEGIIDRFRSLPIRTQPCSPDTSWPVWCVMRSPPFLLSASHTSPGSGRPPGRWSGWPPPAYFWSGCWRFPGCRSASACLPTAPRRRRLHVLRALPAVPEQRLRAHRHDAGGASSDRRPPADHADHRNRSGFLIGTPVGSNGWLALAWCAAACCWPPSLRPRHCSAAAPRADRTRGRPPD